MSKVLEETLKKCPKCKKKTVHVRNNTKTGGVMLLVHLVLTVVTAGVWLALLIIYKILTAKIGGWTCKECL